MVEPRFFMDNYCATCKLCEKSCPARMFLCDEEEQVLLNGALHPRGKRRNLDLCNISCFGLHGLSIDKKWSSWGRHWIDAWIHKDPDPTDKKKIRRQMLAKGLESGDSAPRYEAIRKNFSILWPEEKVEGLIPEYKDLPEDEDERFNLLSTLVKNMGTPNLEDPVTLTCGQCSLVCGPNFEETTKRFNLLMESGIVLPGENGRMVHAKTYEEAAAIKKQHPIERPSGRTQFLDILGNLKIWYGRYFGIEPTSMIQGWKYHARAKRALEEKALNPGPSKLLEEGQVSSTDP
jgi:hypothetical protein